MTPVPVPPTELSVVQQWFQAVITHPEGVADGVASESAQSLLPIDPANLASMITPSSKLSAAERLAVYANAYYARLIECLGEVYPLTRKSLEEEAFADLTVDYLQHHPSRSYTLHALGRHFPEYLENIRPERTSPDGPDWADFVRDLARFEWLIYEVFDGPGTEKMVPFPAQSLLDVPVARWSELQLETAPCLRLLRTDFPINDYFTAARLSTSEEAPSAPEPAVSHVALTRRDYVVRRHPLSAAQFEILTRLQAGVDLGQALQEVLAGESSENPNASAEQVRTWFGLWMREGFFTGYRLQNG